MEPSWLLSIFLRHDLIRYVWYVGIVYEVCYIHRIHRADGWIKVHMPYAYEIHCTGWSCHSFISQVLTILEKRAPELEYILVDTPGKVVQAFGNTGLPVFLTRRVHIISSSSSSMANTPTHVFRHHRSNRSLYLVSFWSHNYRDPGNIIPDRLDLHRRYTTYCSTNNLHVKHALCLFYPVQDEVTHRPDVQ